MNVVIVNDNAHINGGAAKLAITEAAGLAERGHTVVFVSALLPIAPELRHPRIEVLCTEQHDLLANPSRAQAFVQGWWNHKAYQLMTALLARFRAADTVVHLHVWSRALSSSVVKAALDSRLPVICTLHDFILACPTGTFFIHPKQEICHLRPLSAACICTNCDARSYGQKLWRVGRQVIQKHISQAPGGITDFIVHSELAREKMRQYLPAGANVHTVKTYIDSERGLPAQPEENHKLIYLGRLVHEKGVEMLANAARDENIPLIFAGSGPLEHEIRTAAPEATVTGWLDRAASTGYLRSARALVFPSLWHETLGLVVLEAAAQGIASIVPDTSAAKELITDGVNGLHFIGGDQDDLRRKMRLLYDDPALAARLGRAAHHRFWADSYSSLSSHILSLETAFVGMLHRQQSGRSHDLAKTEATKDAGKELCFADANTDTRASRS